MWQNKCMFSAGKIYHYFWKLLVFIWGKGLWNSASLVSVLYLQMQKLHNKQLQLGIGRVKSRKIMWLRKVGGSYSRATPLGLEIILHLFGQSFSKEFWNHLSKHFSFCPTLLSTAFWSQRFPHDITWSIISFYRK